MYANPGVFTLQGFAGRFITEYVDKSTGGDALNVGELWVDLDWQEGGLAFNQDGARQAIVNWIDETQQRSTAFDFVTKGILQVRNVDNVSVAQPTDMGNCHTVFDVPCRFGSVLVMQQGGRHVFAQRIGGCCPMFGEYRGEGNGECSLIKHSTTVQSAGSSEEHRVLALEG